MEANHEIFEVYLEILEMLIHTFFLILAKYELILREESRPSSRIIFHRHKQLIQKLNIQRRKK